MPRFQYLALDGAGSEVRGHLDGPSADWVSQRLVADELLPIEIAGKEAQESWVDAIRKHLPVGVEDLSLFSNQFALMLDTGLPILTALELLAENATKLKLRHALEGCMERIREGNGLHDGLSQSGQFPDIYLNMIRAAEASGTLVEVLNQLSTYLDREAELKGRIKGALTYPAFLVLLSVGVVTFLMVAIIPKFTDILLNLGVELPWPTKVLIAVSGVVTGQWPWIVGTVAALVVGALLLLRDEALRLRLDGLLLRAPFLGELIAKNSLARFSFVLGSLLRGGIPIVEALEVAGSTAGNRQVRQAVSQARHEIMGGRGIAESMEITGAMPPLVLQMTSIGEATGNLDQVLVRVSELYDQQVARVTDVLIRLIEPAMIVVLGGVVGFIALSLVLPMVKAVASFGG